MSKEWSTFMDGDDCRDCKRTDKTIARLAADNARLREMLKVAVEYMESETCILNMNDCDHPCCQAFSQIHAMESSLK